MLLGSYLFKQKKKNPKTRNKNQKNLTFHCLLTFIWVFKISLILATLTFFPDLAH